LTASDPPPRPGIDLSIIIVSWNVRDLLAACLESIAAAPFVFVAPDGGSHSPNNSLLSARGERGQGGEVYAEVIILDSASTDGSPYMIRHRFPWVRLIEEEENVGFTRGSNIALEAAIGRHLLLLNPDTVVHGDALNLLVDYLDAHPDVGIVGPRVLNDDGTTQSTRRRFPTLATAIFESTWLQGYAPRRILDDFYMNDRPDEDTFDVDWVQGCALMARRAVYDAIGPLDEGYIMYSEELDWCKRAKLDGWRVVYVGSAEITHYGGKSTEQVQADRHIHFQQSKIRYFRKYYGAMVAFALRVFLLVSYGAQIAQEGLKALIGHKRAMRRQRIAVYTQVVRALAQKNRT
jgi:N-acetylglucosaminyl-diphospho-decaprenol L-rhamnosyltransferase